MFKYKSKQFFLELLWIKSILHDYQVHISVIPCKDFINTIKQFISEETYNFLLSISENIRYLQQLSHYIDIAYHNKPKKYPIIKIITAKPINNAKIREHLKKKIHSYFPDGVIVEVVKSSIIGGCILEIDEVLNIDASYRSRLDGILNQMQEKLQYI